MNTIASFTVQDAGGSRTSLSRYAGRVVLVVNTATDCVHTPQLKGMEELQQRYAGRAFDVLAFPCNQFGAQAAGTSEEIAMFCRDRYATSFPSFGKVDVNGPTASPFFSWLKSQAPGALGTSDIKWNFTKFLIDRRGKPVVRFAPTMEPINIAFTIDRLLRQEAA